MLKGHLYLTNTYPVSEANTRCTVYLILKSR